MKRLSVIEGQTISVGSTEATAIRKRLAELQKELRPRFPFVSGDIYPKVMNLIGTVQVSKDLVLDIKPKVYAGQNWTRALAELMTTERAHLGGEQEKSEWTARNAIPEILAATYARQLTTAVRQEGPLTLIRSQNETQGRLAGKLDISRWVISRISSPHLFPQATSRLSADNQFTAAMAWVANVLEKQTKDLAVRSLLQSAARELRPGLPPHIQINKDVASAEIPAQWSAAYNPAWSTARSVLRQISAIHRHGSLHGFSIALEPWPLLETALTRAVQSAVEQAVQRGVYLHSPPGRPQETFLQTRDRNTNIPLNRVHTNRAVEPDALIYLGERVAATFEAKYNYASQESTRHHFFQTLTTAAAFNAPLSVIVYPEKSEPIAWDVKGFDGTPLRIVALGLDMFDYKRGRGDRERGALLLNLVLGVHGLDANPK